MVIVKKTAWVTRVGRVNKQLYDISDILRGLVYPLRYPLERATIKQILEADYSTIFYKHP